MREKTESRSATSRTAYAGRASAASPIRLERSVPPNSRAKSDAPIPAVSSEVEQEAFHDPADLIPDDVPLGVPELYSNLVCPVFTDLIKIRADNPGQPAESRQSGSFLFCQEYQCCSLLMRCVPARDAHLHWLQNTRNSPECPLNQVILTAPVQQYFPEHPGIEEIPSLEPAEIGESFQGLKIVQGDNICRGAPDIEKDGIRVFFPQVICRGKPVCRCQLRNCTIMELTIRPVKPGGWKCFPDRMSQ